MRISSSLVLVVLVGCSGPEPAVPDGAGTEPTTTAAEVSSTPVANSSPPASAPPGELDIDPSSFDFSKNPELTDRIAESPHAYFRFVGHRFSAAVCKRLAQKADGQPRVRLHGDPHVEQYAVTDLGRWMSDYDDASVGPAAVDLVRMGTSVILAARQQKLSAEETDKLLVELFRGYKDGLKNGLLPKTPPPFAAALNAKFAKDRKGFLEYADKSTLAPTEDEEKLARAKFDEYVGAVKGKSKNGFFTVKKVGRLKLGIGSALSKKFLIRLEGPGVSPDDDVIVEIKEVADLSPVPCVTGVPGGAAAARAAEQKLAPAGKNLLQPVLLSDGKFWVNEWLSNYQEARIKKLAAADLEPLVYEAGLILGLEHIKAPPEGKAPKGETLAPNANDVADMQKAMRELADASTSGWERFKKEVATGSK
ncbi:MAG: DUF2252 family protein [Polyangiaceae bacterium]|nr:DUF2252 family protein [Polyangiaceae bacterium]